MHSFQPSRGRILFEAFCVLGIAGSLAGAWQQTGASALLAASAAAALFGLSHAFGMRRASAAVEPRHMDFASVERDDHLVSAKDIAPPMVERQKEPIQPVVAIAPAEPVVSQAKKVRQAKTPRKSSSGRGGRKETKVAELVPFEPVEAMDLAPSEEADIAVPVFDEEPDYPRIEPLFEPEPHFRQHRTVFGRKAG